MQPRRRRNRVILGVLALGLLAGVALTAHPARAQEVNEVAPSVSAVGPYYALPSWDQKIAAATRFVVLTNWSSQAVLDKETGLVWMRSPQGGVVNQQTASAVCLGRTVGNRKGWRLPSLPELASLIDPSAPAPFLPVGHPFLNVRSTLYWSATTDAEVPTLAWGVLFNNDGVVTRDDKTAPGYAWCVRGGMHADQY